MENTIFLHLTSTVNFHRRHCRRPHAAAAVTHNVKLNIFRWPDKYPTFLQKKVSENLLPIKKYSYLYFSPVANFTVKNSWTSGYLSSLCINIDTPNKSACVLCEAPWASRYNVRPSCRCASIGNGIIFVGSFSMKGFTWSNNKVNVPRDTRTRCLNGHPIPSTHSSTIACHCFFLRFSSCFPVFSSNIRLRRKWLSK